METKSFWKSKMFWLGVIELATGLLGYAGVVVAGSEPFTWAGLATIVLRFLSNKQITLN